MSRHLAVSLALALALAGCMGAPVTGPAPTGKLPVKDPVTGKIISNAPVEPLNGIEFRPLTVANAKYLSGNGGGGVRSNGGSAMEMSAPMPAAAPMADMAVAKGAPAPATGGASMVGGSYGGGVSRASSGGASTSTAGGAYSGNVWGGYGYRYYFGFGGGSEQMALVSVQEAETQGAKGGLAEIIAGVVGPVVKDWALDARLTEAGSTLTNEGALYVEPQMAGGAKIMPVRLSPLEGGDGWRLVYLSSVRSEMLQFIVTPEKTTLVRMRWAPLDLAPERIKVDSTAAIGSVVKAVSDKGFASVEEQSMKDYFLGHAFEQPKTGEYDGDTQRTEVLYQVPANARWNVSLQQVVGKLVWDLNWYATDEKQPVAVAMPGVAVAAPMVAFRLLQDVSVAPMPAVISAPMPAVISAPMPMPVPSAEGCNMVQRKETSTWTNHGGSAMVDAETGAIIRFTRPTRVTNTWDNWICEPVGKPSPVPTIAPSARPEPNATPTPAATESVEADGEASGA